METAASAAQHAELVERINQLNILRESNATLRADCESHAKRSRALEAKLKQVSAQLHPAQEQARVAQAELEARDAQLKRLEDENKKWQERNTQLLSKVSGERIVLEFLFKSTLFSTIASTPPKSSLSKTR